MKRKKIVKKLKNAARQALIFALCIGYILVIVPNESHAAASYQGYLWHRIKSQDQFYNFAGGSIDNSDGRINTGEEYVPNNVEYGGVKTAPENLAAGRSSDWFRVMMIYGGSDERFISGNNSCNGNESFMGQYANASYGIDTKKDWFITTSGLNTPYIKYVNWDGDNNCGRFFVRFSDNDQLGRTYWNMYTKWYGIAYHAAASCTFDRPGRDIDNWKDDANWWSYQSFQWKNGGVFVRYNIANTSDRGWEWWSDGEIECTQDFDDSVFKLYIGVQYPVSTISTTFTIPEGQTASWNYYVVGKGAAVTVSKGATLIIDGTCYNNGVITVEEGASVVIRGVLDTAIPQGNDSFSPTDGRMEFKKGSLLLVEDTGILITRNPYVKSAFSFESCTVDIQGTAVFTQAFTLDGTDFRVGYGAAACVGVIPNSGTGVSTYTKAWIHKNKDAYLSSLCSNNATKDAAGEAAPNLKLQRCSSLQSNGIFFLNPSLGIYAQGYAFSDFYTTDEVVKNGYWTDSFISINRSSNINASIKKMMLKW